MNLREKIYQMFILGVDLEKPAPASNLQKALSDNLGGVILFTKNIKTFEQTKQLISDIKKSAKTPVFVSIDQEGGRVERTQNLFGGEKFLSAKSQAHGGAELVFAQTEKISHLLLELGFNMNFAPVLDVNTNPDNPIIGERAYSSKTEDVEKFGLLAVKTYLENGIIPVVKHFPGHGDTDVDSHIELPECTLSLEELEKIHIAPFKRAVELKAPAVMVSHVFYTCFDTEKTPASLSKNIIQNYLIDKLHFKGVVISDDMVMGGVRGYEPVEALILGVLAGINIFIFRDSDDKTIKIIEDFISAVEKNPLLTEKTESSFEKIKFLKQSLD